MARLNDRFAFIIGGEGGLTGLLNYIQVRGKKHESRIGLTHELLNAKVEWNSLDAPYRPGMARKLGMVELLQVVSGYFDERHLAKAAPGLRYPYGLTHAYGIKIAQQLPKVIQQLNQSSQTRRALIHIGKPEDGQEVEKPCMQSYQFQIRNHKLHTTIYARSWDAVSGLPYDVLVANGIAQMVANLTYTEASTTTFLVGSLHIYDEVWDELKVRNIEKLGTFPPYSTSLRMPDLESFEDYRTWAMDELNDMDNWERGLPKGINNYDKSNG